MIAGKDSKMGVASFLSADVLGIGLMQKGDSVWGAGTKSFPLLSWKLDAWVQAQSDIVTDKECAMWVSITKRLWLYLITSPKACHILVFDADELGITFDKSDSFGGVSIKDTINEIRSAVKAVFKFVGSGEDKNEKWETSSLKSLPY